MTKSSESATVVDESVGESIQEDINLSAADEKEEEDIMTPEEATAVKKSMHAKDFTEINVEKLLHIAFQTLLEEWNLLSMPVYSTVERPHLIADGKKEEGKEAKIVVMANQVVVIDSNKWSSPPPQPQEEEVKDNNQSSSWLQVQVMARPSSLGTILDRFGVYWCGY
jgi:hypothetical protein